MEWKIGEIRQINGEWYQCIKGESEEKCTDCFFRYLPICMDLKCLGNERKDHTKVIFKKLEKLGEPYQYVDGIYQQYKATLPFFIRDATYTETVMGFAIKIKQNQEDMEEKKLNLKPFDIQKAREGKPVCTRDGRKARIICFDAEGNKPLIVLSKIDGKEIILRYTEKGQSDNYHSPTPREDDLMALPEKKEGYANIVKEALSDDKVVLGRIFDNYEDALRSGEANERYVATVKIQWEE